MKPKILCICENGNNRSVFLAYRLKRKGYEALACGWRSSSAETFAMLCQWADIIIVLQAGFDVKVHPSFRHKVHTLDVGPDRWGPQWNRELKQIVYKGYDQLVVEGVIA